jgi:hypothetical protein
LFFFMNVPFWFQLFIQVVSLSFDFLLIYPQIVTILLKFVIPDLILIAVFLQLVILEDIFIHSLLEIAASFLYRLPFHLLLPQLLLELADVFLKFEISRTIGTKFNFIF